jgi:uncharacterized repeat protein (TIGR01451 family)
VIAPSLSLTASGPGLRYLGRTANYLVTVTNDGAAPTNNVRVIHKLPNGFEFVEADHGGKFDRSSQTVTWFLGRLGAGESLALNAKLSANALGDFVHQLVATSEHGANADAQVATRVDGTASLVLEIVDLDDPVEIARETAWEVRVRNDGSKAAENVSLVCELPRGVDFVTAKGASDFVTESGTVLFRPLPQLPPGKTALYRVHVRGVTPGNHRFRAKLASDSIQEPLTFEELTKFYQD